MALIAVCIHQIITSFTQDVEVELLFNIQCSGLETNGINI